MKILFDLCPLQPSNEAPFHGGGELTEFWLKTLLKNDIRPVVCFKTDRILKKEHLELIELYNLQVLKFNSNKQITNFCKEFGIDIFFSSLPYEYGNMNFEDTIFHMAILGLRELEMNHLGTRLSYSKNLTEKLKIIYRYLLFERKSKRKEWNKINQLFLNKKYQVTTISNHSKYSIASFFPELNAENISVYYSPSDLTICERRKVDGFKIVLVSGNRWIKNIKRAILAIDSLISDNLIKDVQISIFGWEDKTPIKIENTENFKLSGYVDRDELNMAFSQSSLFIYPSLNEGYGYPPLNAMRHDIPVIASGLSSIPEICGKAALYFNPFNVDEIRNRILMVYDSDETRNILIEEGRKRLSELRVIQENGIRLFIKNFIKP
jgi:glycosyltransferase involved in cell wall biosynthesis